MDLRNNRGETALKQAIRLQGTQVTQRLILEHFLKDGETIPPEYVKEVEWASNFWNRCQSELAELSPKIFRTFSYVLLFPPPEIFLKEIPLN